MERCRQSHKAHRGLFVSVNLSAFALIVVLSACSSGTGQQSALEASSVGTVTEVPLGTSPIAGTPTLTGPALDATKFALIAGPADAQQTVAAEATSFALGTPYPVGTPFLLPTLAPARTPILGISGQCAQGDNLFYYGGCWAGLVNNEYWFVRTGAFKSDPLQGEVLVYTTTLDLDTYGTHTWYTTPAKAGSIHPVQVTWPILRLRSVAGNPPADFTFNLLTDQWLDQNLTPIPLPTISPLPSPSASPLASPIATP